MPSPELGSILQVKGNTWLQRRNEKFRLPSSYLERPVTVRVHASHVHMAACQNRVQGFEASCGYSCSGYSLLVLPMSEKSTPLEKINGKTIYVYIYIYIYM